MVDRFLSQLAATYKKAKPSATPEVMDLFCRYDWPGNVRELKNLLERVFIVNNDDTISAEDLPSDFVWHFEQPLSIKELAEVRRQAETRAILDALYRTGGDREKAAKILRISPRTLRYKLNQYDVKVDRQGQPVSQGSFITPAPAPLVKTLARS
jgi:DNA-binding NtrC family response regulator